jgi:hypothetical protein
MQWYLILISTLLFGTDLSDNEKLRELTLLGQVLCNVVEPET